MADQPRVRVSDEVWEVIEDHSFGRLDVEVGGFLFGRIEGIDVEVTAAHAALAATSEQTHLTFTHEAWDDALSVLDREFPGQAIVGWYHTHPGFGLFLSDYDLFIQQNFFAAQGQFALVVDPLIGEYAMFIAEAGQAVRFSAGSTTRPAVAGSTGSADAAALRAELGSSSGGRVRTESNSRATVIVAAVVGVVVGALAWFIGNVQGGDQARTDAAQEITRIQGQLASSLAQPMSTDVPAPAVPSASPSRPGSPLPVASPGQTLAVLVPVPVRQGDTWWGISARLLGSGSRFKELQAVNPGVALRPGGEILVPVDAIVSGGGE